VASEREKYTGTPLPKKLGITADSRVALIAAPEGFDRTIGPLPDGVTVSTHASWPLDVIVFFTTTRDELVERFPELARALDPAGGLWIAWPKKSSSLDTDLSQNVVMEVGISDQLVDNKVCAIDEDWSALRFVVRKQARDHWPPS
jgi:hypothetical protein